MSDNDNNVIELGPRDNMTTEEALELTRRENPKQVLILFFGEDDIFALHSSNMPRRDALWLIEMGRSHVMGLLDD